MSDTIFALSSGALPAAIAVVRISGPSAAVALEALAGKLPEPRRLVLRALHDPQDEMLLDRALVAWLPSAQSATGEDLAELHLHGSRATVAAVEAALERQPGLRPARAGEFTWRAYENGKMDLVAVESLSDLLRAETESQRRAALAGDRLSLDVERWRGDVLQLSAIVEAQLDQSDEDDVPPDRKRIGELAERLSFEIGEMLARPGAERLFDGVRVVLAGAPNSGKSSLINALAGREVAITSPVAGTTRDVIEAPVTLSGVAFVLTDTAGLRVSAADPIEQVGIQRAAQRIEAADLVVWMDDAPPPVMPASKLIHIIAKSDLRPEGDRLRVSALNGEGLQALAGELAARARSLLPREGEVALSRRQRAHLERCRSALLDFRAEHDELLAAEHLRRARSALDELTGRAGTEEMLDALFGTFCIGK